MADVRCPRCDRKLGEDLVGKITLWCRTCRKEVTIDRQPAPT